MRWSYIVCIWTDWSKVAAGCICLDRNINVAKNWPTGTWANWWEWISCVWIDWLALHCTLCTVYTVKSTDNCKWTILSRQHQLLLIIIWAPVWFIPIYILYLHWLIWWIDKRGGVGGCDGEFVLFSAIHITTSADHNACLVIVAKNCEYRHKHLHCYTPSFKKVILTIKKHIHPITCVGWDQF